MRDLRGHMITEPKDRFNRINQLIENFAKAGLLNEWQLKVNENFANVVAKQLYHPQILDPQNNQRTWGDYEGRKFKHTEPVQLLKGKWTIVYGKREYEQANALYENLQKASGAYGVRVEEPQWVEVGDFRSADGYNAAIRSDINPKECLIVCVVVFSPEVKKGVKSFLDKGGVVSQFITAKKLGGKLSLGVFSNLLKQINAKVKQDLYRVSLPNFKNAMVIGVDLIMNGSSKLIGCCATSSQTLTQCYTRLYKQKMPRVTEEAKAEYPGKSRREVQELLITFERSNILKGFVNDAMGNYQKNTKTLPEKIIIYRDGMGGPSMTTKVQEHEVKVITDLLENTSPGYKPKILYCLVDRNIQHRVFVKSGQDCLNPGNGTVIDSAVVEVQGDTIFDFYMIPHKATVATA
jgi:aubergine